MSFITGINWAAMKASLDAANQESGGYDGSGINPNGMYTKPLQDIADAKAYYDSLSPYQKKAYEPFWNDGGDPLTGVYQYLAQNKRLFGSYDAYDGYKNDLLTTTTNQSNCNCKQPIWHFVVALSIGGMIGYFISKN